MSSGIAAATEIDDRWGETPQVEARPAAILKGGPRGLEILVDGGASVDAIAAALTGRLEEAPGFFRGSDVRVRIEGALPAGCLGRLEEIATRFELAIVEVGPRKPRPVEGSAPVPRPALAAGTAPAVSAAEGQPALETQAPAASATEAQPALETQAPAASAPEAQPPVAAPAAPAAPDPVVEAVDPRIDVSIAAPAPERTRMVVGPVRSGVILDHPGNLIVVGDVNPGAEVRAQGNIVILGRLRGIAHAGIGREHGFILALRLEPQQLRIGRLAARAPDAASSGTEIAYVTDRNIVVEGYAGKLPSGLAAGI
ncbi:MAG TPA: septum site-determining protein MinC [Kofleriaceae bacterium]|nr:septum site-determining protein MinC [Kofleriaceae bacterium]